MEVRAGLRVPRRNAEERKGSQRWEAVSTVGPEMTK